MSILPPPSNVPNRGKFPANRSAGGNRVPTFAPLPMPTIRYVKHDDEAPTLKRPALSEDTARDVLVSDRAKSALDKPPTLPPLVIDATVERFVATPIADSSYDDLEPPTIPMEGSRTVRVAGVAALFVLIACGSATLGAAAARAHANSQVDGLVVTWMSAELHAR